MRRILVAVDGSPGALKAVDFAADLAAKYNAELILLAVADAGAPVVDTALEDYARIEHIADAMPETGAAAAETALAAARVEAWANGAIHLSSVSGFGDAAEEILRCAGERAADLIVLGNRGHGRLGALLHGSVGHKVIGRAPCTVAIVR